MGGGISKEGESQSYDQLVLLSDEFIQSYERDESNHEPDSIQSEKEEKPIKNRELCKLVMETIDLSDTLVSHVKKVYLEGRNLQQKETKFLGIPIRRIERNSLEKYVGTLKTNLQTYLEKLYEISQKFESLKVKADKKLKSAKLWGKILSIFYQVAYVVVSLTVYMILVISMTGMIMVSPLLEVIWETVKIFLKSIAKRVKSLWKNKEEDLKAQMKFISSVQEVLDGVQDNIHQLLEENADQELSEILQKATVLQKQAEEFLCYMENRKKHCQEHHGRTYRMKRFLLKINPLKHQKKNI
ncbi:hypothetical protein NE237_000242 [Protea cynaroides]|uniref:Uncharacterized protein n=1 Tax=Protea cynaroides TaxID=273540 RepID=A0A9Q0KRN6_9MAGN|nr:hypothetical protein NE237_000242 [Protea cynaroides]